MLSGLGICYFYGMKISRIQLEDFHQFKDLDIDLTYPKGHPKEGNPLDKVCIIGQSGTGKTTLLKIIAGHTFTIESLVKEYGVTALKNIKVTQKFGTTEVPVSVFYDDTKKTNRYKWGTAKRNGQQIAFQEALNEKKRVLKRIKRQFIYLPADLQYEFQPAGADLSDKSIIDFTKNKVGDIWNLVFEEIQKSQEEEIKLKHAIARAAIESNTNIQAINSAVKALVDWRKTEVNPVTKLAEDCLDPILKQLNLRVRRDFTFDSKDDIGIVKLEDLNGNEVPYHLLSTGTKQILLTALPLYLLKPDQTLILCDEPERSLYPTMQKIITSFYTSLTKNSQFIFATHSPIIAAEFEPWEVIELKFNDDGTVYQECYFPMEKERHVDNYSLFPSYLTYDQILSKVFDMKETVSTERNNKITEALMLRGELMKLKEQGDTTSNQADETYLQYKKLASKLFWDFEIASSR